MRLFLAIPPEPGFRAALEALQEHLRAQGVRGSYTRPENLHLTLAFIGEFGSPDAVMDALCPLEPEPFGLTLSGVGLFPEVLWAGLAPSPELERLVRQLRRLLAEKRIPYDRKRFVPHITLVRRPVGLERAALPTVPPAEMRVRRVALLSSVRGRSGMIYTELAHIPVPGRETAPPGSGML